MRYALVVISLLFLCSREVPVDDENHGTYIPFNELKLRQEPAPRTVIWGSKVSDAFRKALYAGCNEECLEPDPIMACIAFETGKKFSPSVKNMAGSGAVGLIQFMPDTAKYLGTSTALLAAMTAEQQLAYVFKHFHPYRNRLVTITDYYMTILYPVAIGQPNDYVLFRESYMGRTNLVAYVQNKGLDRDHNGLITKIEAAMPVIELFEEGKKYIK